MGAIMKFMDKYIIPVAGKLGAQRHLVAVRDGFVAMIPITMIGALAKYISTENEKFQPMNANFGILPELEVKIRDKKERYATLADRALEALKNKKR